MDEAELFKMSGASAGTVAILFLIYRLLKTAVGKRYISNCCGRKIEVGLEVREGTTPKLDEVAIDIKNPLHTRDESHSSRSEQSHTGSGQGPIE